MTAIALREITDVMNPKRRQRTYPRVVKRHCAKHHNIKRSWHHGKRHQDQPEIHIYNIQSVT